MPLLRAPSILAWVFGSCFVSSSRRVVLAAYRCACAGSHFLRSRSSFLSLSFSRSRSRSRSKSRSRSRFRSLSLSRSCRGELVGVLLRACRCPRDEAAAPRKVSRPTSGTFAWGATAPMEKSSFVTYARTSASVTSPTGPSRMLLDGDACHGSWSATEQSLCNASFSIPNRFPVALSQRQKKRKNNEK